MMTRRRRMGSRFEGIYRSLREWRLEFLAVRVSFRQLPGRRLGSKSVGRAGFAVARGLKGVRGSLVCRLERQWICLVMIMNGIVSQPNTPVSSDRTAKKMFGLGKPDRMSSLLRSIRLNSRSSKITFGTTQKYQIRSILNKPPTHQVQLS